MKIQCKHCGRVIDGSKQRRWQMEMCDCGRVGLDETKYYCRYSGNPEDIEIIGSKGKPTLPSNALSEQKRANEFFDSIKGQLNLLSKEAKSLVAKAEYLTASFQSLEDELKGI